MKNLNKHERLSPIPDYLKECDEVSFFGINYKLYKPLKITYNNEYIFYIHRPDVKHFIENFAVNYTNEERKEINEALTVGYNNGLKKYSNTFDLTETGAKNLLNELSGLQKKPFKQTQINFAELKFCGEIEGEISCIYRIINSNLNLFQSENLTKIDSLKTQKNLALYLALIEQELPKGKENFDKLMDKYKVPKWTGTGNRFYHTFISDYNDYKHPKYRKELFSKTTENNQISIFNLLIKFCESNELDEHRSIIENELNDYKALIKNS